MKIVGTSERDGILSGNQSHWGWLHQLKRIEVWTQLPVQNLRSYAFCRVPTSSELSNATYLKHELEGGRRLLVTEGRNSQLYRHQHSECRSPKFRRTDQPGKQQWNRRRGELQLTVEVKQIILSQMNLPTTVIIVIAVMALCFALCACAGWLCCYLQLNIRGLFPARSATIVLICMVLWSYYW